VDGIEHINEINRGLSMIETGRRITMRGLQIVWRVFLCAVVLYIWLAERHHPTNKQIGSGFYATICIISICLVGTMFSMQKRFAMRLHGPTADMKQIRRAYAVQLLLMGCSLAVVLYGLVVRFAGATVVQALPFYVVGSLLLLYFKPMEIDVTEK
jgi:hypothetical protein